MQKPLTMWITTNCGEFLGIGTPDHLMCLLRNLYPSHEVSVRIRLGTTDWFKIGKVHQAVYCHPAYWTYMQSTLGKAMASHFSTLAWKIPWMEEPGRLQSMGSLRVRHDWVTSLSLFTFMHWRKKWQPTPLFLPGESQGQRSLVGCHLWGLTESDTTESIQQQQQQSTLCKAPSWITHKLELRLLEEISKISDMQMIPL